MPLFVLILLFNLLGSLGGLIGGILLLWKEKFIKRIFPYFLSFGAGALLSVAFLDLLPQALEEGLNQQVMFFTLLGILIFYFIETFFIISHTHNSNDTNIPSSNYRSYLLSLGDTIHNFTDGLVMALTFLVNIPLGIATSLAVFFHEIPHEMADFAVMLSWGLPKKKVLIFNIVSALATLVGAFIIYFFSFYWNFNYLIAPLLSLSAGGFIYIATSDLLPELHHQKDIRKIFLQIFWMLGSILLIYLVYKFLSRI